MEYKTSTISGVCSVVTDGSHYSPKSVDDGCYMVSVKDFTEYGFDFSGCRKISEQDYADLKKAGCVPEYGDILVGKDGARYFEDIIIYRQPEKPALLSSIAILRCNTNEILPEYLYYLLRTPSFKKDVKENYGSGSAIPRIILKDFKRMPVQYPALEMQKKVVSILEKIDSKIQTNSKINDNLYEILQSVFQSRFGLSEESARVGTLLEICAYSKDRVAVSKLGVKNYYSTENMLPSKAGSVDAASLPTTQQTTKCNIGDVLVSNIRPYFKKIVYCQSEGGCSTDVLCFTPKLPSLSSYLFCTLYADSFFNYMVAGSKGTKMPRGDKLQIMTYPVVIPTEDELRAFDEVAQPILRQIHINSDENTYLAALRDTLLPKLMSGEIDVSDIQR